MSYKIHRMIDTIKLIEKSRYMILLPSLVIFVFMALTTSQSTTYANTPIYNNTAYAQLTNQTTTSSATAMIDPKGENKSLTSPSSTIPNSNTGREINASSPSYREAFTPNRQITLIAEDAEIEIAPGKRVLTWTFNGTVPAPTIRLAEDENVTIKFINKSQYPTQYISTATMMT